jgi:chemotaxis protein methyltransferase CheR
LHGRLAQRVRELGFASFGEYYRRVVADQGELVQFIDRITTNETHFFREPHHFAHIAERVAPALLRAAAEGTRPKTVRAWSAGCSTGEEPYSIAMTLLGALAQHGWTVDVLATDVSTRVLDVARGATWSVTRARSIPVTLLHRYMLRGIGSSAGLVRATPELHGAVRVERLNLNDDAYPAREPFDLIFCRNVLIYFQPARRVRVLSRLVRRLAPGGLLFVGHAESLQGVPERLRCVCPTVYAQGGAS